MVRGTAAPAAQFTAATAADVGFGSAAGAAGVAGRDAERAGHRDPARDHAAFWERVGGDLSQLPFFARVAEGRDTGLLVGLAVKIEPGVLCHEVPPGSRVWPFIHG